jgi:nucleoid-associated protein YgaU
MNNTSAIRRNVRRGAAALILGGTAVGAMALPANAVPTSTWDALAECESGGNWGISTGNGFSGGLQFTPSTWAAFGGQGDPTNASKSEQIAVAERVLDGQGWGAWPACSSQLGLSGNAGATPTAVTPQSTSVAPVAAPAPAAPKAVEAPAPVAAPVVQYVAPAATVAPAAVSGGSYTVTAGDTLSVIAGKLGVKGGWEALAAANGGTIADPNLIFPGQVLNIPA